MLKFVVGYLDNSQVCFIYYSICQQIRRNGQINNKLKQSFAPKLEVHEVLKMTFQKHYILKRINFVVKYKL